MKQLKQEFEKQYTPIEPEGISINLGLEKLYYRILKKCLEEKDEIRNLAKTLIFGLIAPGSSIFINHRIHEVRNEIMQEEDESFIKSEPNSIKLKVMGYLADYGIKPFLAYGLSHDLARLIDKITNLNF